MSNSPIISELSARHPESLVWVNDTMADDRKQESTTVLGVTVVVCPDQNRCKYTWFAQDSLGSESPCFSGSAPTAIQAKAMAILKAREITVQRFTEQAWTMG